MNLVNLFAVGMLILFGSTPANGKSNSMELVGWVSDESCGAVHTRPGGEDCVQKCIKGAPHLNPEWVAQRMIFVTDEDEALWFVANPEVLKGEEGQHLRIVAVAVGKGEKDGNGTLRVLSKARVEGETR